MYRRCTDGGASYSAKKRSRSSTVTWRSPLKKAESLPLSAADRFSLGRESLSAAEFLRTGPQRVNVAQQQNGVGQHQNPAGRIHEVAQRRPKRNDEAEGVADSAANQQTAQRRPVVRGPNEPVDESELDQCQAEQSEAQDRAGTGWNAIGDQHGVRSQQESNTIQNRNDCDYSKKPLKIFH